VAGTHVEESQSLEVVNRSMNLREKSCG